MLEIKVLDTSKNRELWKKLVDALALKDIYFTPEYAMLFEATEGEVREAFGGEALLFFYGNEQNYIIYPFFKRKVSELPFRELLPPESQGWFDIISPYGYSGPIAYISEPKIEGELWQGFVKEFHHYCLQNNIVAEFARLHPYFRNHLLLEKFTDINIVKRAELVYVDLEQEEAVIKRGISRGNKSSMSKARRSGVSMLCLDSEKEPGSFHQL